MLPSKLDYMRISLQYVPDNSEAIKFSNTLSQSLSPVGNCKSISVNARCAHIQI